MGVSRIFSFSALLLNGTLKDRYLFENGVSNCGCFILFCFYTLQHSNPTSSLRSTEDPTMAWSLLLCAAYPENGGVLSGLNIQKQHSAEC